MERPPVGDAESLELLKRGVRQMGNHLVGPGFGMKEAGIAAAKAAWLARALGSGQDDNPDLPRWNGGDNPEILRDAELPSRFAPIEKLKKFNIEAYFYWRQ